MAENDGEDLNDFFAKKKKKGKKKAFAANMTSNTLLEETDHNDAPPLTVPVVQEDVEDAMWGSMENKKKTVVATGGKTLANFESSQTIDEATVIAARIKLEESRETFHSTRAAALERVAIDEEKKKQDEEIKKAKAIPGTVWSGAGVESLGAGWRERQKQKQEQERTSQIAKMQEMDFPTLGGPAPASTQTPTVIGAWSRIGGPKEEEPEGERIIQNSMEEAQESKPIEPIIEEQSEKAPAEAPQEECVTVPVIDKAKLTEKFGKKKKKKKKAEGEGEDEQDA